MPVKQFDGRIGPRPHNLVGIGECFCHTRNGFCHFWMGRVEMLLPFCSQPNHSIMEVVEKLHGYIYVLWMPNFVFDDSPSSSIGYAGLLRCSIVEHPFQGSLMTARRQAPASAMVRLLVIV
jgi:hypothetical protein